MPAPRAHPTRDRGHPPSSWLITKAAVKVLAALSPDDRAVLLDDPLSRRAWHLFRGALHDLDRRHAHRADWLHAPDDTASPTTRETT